MKIKWPEKLAPRQILTFLLEGYGSFIFLMLSLICILSLAGYLVLGKNGAMGFESVVPPNPLPTPISLKPILKEVADTFRAKQTITDALIRHGFSKSDIFELVQDTKPVYNLAKVKAGQPFWLYFAPDGSFRDFRYSIDDEQYLTVYRNDLNHFVPIIKKYPYEVRNESIAGEIDGALITSIVAEGEQETLALELANIFGSDIDFYTDLQKGDSFRLVVEKKYLDGKFRKYGPILAAGFVNQNKQFAGVRFWDEKGKPAYYTPDGKALARSFFKSPLKFVTRVSSRFSGARLHPILKIVRPHLGIDYAAPMGTPVQAVGSGVVLAAEFSGANGRMVHIRHGGGYETRYLHLSRIVVKRGARVEKGDLIGYVGTSGLASGPHLDFRVSYRGKYVNPAKVVFPPAPPVREGSFGKFAALRDTLLGWLNEGDTQSWRASQ